MTATATTEVSTIPTLDHAEAMVLAEAEYRRFVDVLRALDAHDWQQPTDCALWDVHAMAAHCVGNMAQSASMREAFRQQRLTKKRAKADGIADIDAMTAVQVDEHTVKSDAELVAAIDRLVGPATKGRRKVPGIMRRKVMIPMPDPHGKKPLGYLMDKIFTRDTWMHRIDISRAAGRDMVLTAEHDGRIVADVVAEWAANHAEPFTLDLTGPAGGSFVSGAGGESHTLDAVEFCRIMAGRAKGTGLLTTEVLF
ncbi:MAG: maleylpyruvate isomerase family mycothiol-dependent enzyme [Acidimicrobiales bacterium]